MTVAFANDRTMQPLDPKYYDVKYANNDAPGNAVVTVTGKNGYTGTLSMNFTILPNELTASASTNPVEIGRAAEFACVVGNLEGCTISYQWQQSSNGGASWRDCAAKGSDTAEMSYTLTEARRGYLFRCVVTASDGRAATSNAQGFVLAADLPELSAKASSEAAEVGGAATFACSVEGAGDASLSYKWQQSSNGGASWRDCAAKGSDTAEMSYTLTEARRGYLFRCVVTAPPTAAPRPRTPRASCSPPTCPSSPRRRAGGRRGRRGRDVRVLGRGRRRRLAELQVAAVVQRRRLWRDCAAKGSDTAEMSYTLTEARRGYLFRCVVTYPTAAPRPRTPRASCSPPTCPSSPRRRARAAEVGGAATFACSVEGAGDALAELQVAAVVQRRRLLEGLRGQGLRHRRDVLHAHRGAQGLPVPLRGDRLRRPRRDLERPGLRAG